MAATNVNSPNRCWVTLLSRASYLPGVIILAYSLSAEKSRYPLVVLITPSLPKSSIRALKSEAAHNPILKIRTVKPLLLPDSQKTTLIAQRFEDTWTKLRAFELTSYDTCIFLDADIAVFKNIDELFDVQLPSHDWIAACHCCVCNLDHNSWAPSNWTRETCAFTPLSHPSALNVASPMPPTEGPPNSYALLNGGVFMYHPSPALYGRLLEYFNNSPALSTFLFPDQDFLAEFFKHKWIPLSWKYNAIKTMKQWHPNVWRDGEVKALHYIVDKPWARRIASDGIAGHMGRDGETHSWWWNMYQRWRDQRSRCYEQKNGSVKWIEFEVLNVMDELVAPELDDEADTRQCEDNREKGFPIPIPDDHDENSQIKM